MTEKIITPIEVRLTIGAMKHSIVRYFMDYEGQVQEAILKATTEYLDKVNFTSLVQKELQPLLQEHIRSRIKDYLREAIDKTIDNKAEEAVASLFEKAKGGEQCK